MPDPSTQRTHSTAQSVEARIRLTLIDSAEKQVSFSGVLWARQAHWLRLRTWKFLRPVVDTTLTPEGLWVAIGSVVKGSAREELEVSAMDISRAWGTFMCDPNAWGARLDDQMADADESHYVTSPHADGSQILTVVDRRTGQPRRHEVRDAAGAIQRTLSLEQNRVIDGIAWPHRMVLTSPRGRIIIEMSAVELNGELAEEAFAPPKDASRIE